MVPRLIKTILYTLISVNLLALVFGGLITWLSHSIPIRLRQFGLSPELMQVAGFSSLLIACLGLGALNFSSHYALNAYGISCAIFIVFMLFGILPDKWRNSIRDQQQSNLHQQLLQANYTSTLTGSPPKSSAEASSLVLDLIYLTLLLTFGTLLVFAFIFAQYLRRHELDEQENEQLERSAFRGADGLCNRRNCTCDTQQATVAASTGLGSLPNLNHQTSEDSLVPRYSSSSYSALRWAPAPIGGHPWQSRDSQHLRQTLSSRSLVSLNNGRESTDGELDGEPLHDDGGATSSLRHQARRSSNVPLPPLVHRGFYYATNMKDGASSQAPTRRGENLTRQQSSSGRTCTNRAINGQHSAGYPQLNNSYSQSGRSSRSINIDNTRCRCGSSVASTLAAKLQEPSLAYDYQSANKWSHYNEGFSQAGFKYEPYAYLKAASCTKNHTTKRRRCKPSGTSVMAMTAAAAAALFGGVVDSSPLEGAPGQGSADGMLESTLDDCGGAHGDIMENYTHHYEGMPLGSGNSFSHHQHHQAQTQHDSRCELDDVHHEITAAQHADQLEASLVQAPPWDYGPIMSEVMKR